MINDELKRTEQITYSLNILRIKRDIAYHEAEVARTKLHTVAETDPFSALRGRNFKTLRIKERTKVT